MITAVSIFLYLVAALFAAAVGVVSEQTKTDKKNMRTGKFGLVAFIIFFVLAATLQVSA